jgi:hypothetical protein
VFVSSRCCLQNTSNAHNTDNTLSGCSQLACLNCCSDADCEGHKDTREQSKWRQDVLAGATMVQRKAAQKRSHSIIEKAFKEKKFAYMNQTILIWSLDEYLQNPKWRDDAIRKAEKRKAYESMDQKIVLKNSQKRFRALLERKYQDSINK